MAWCAFLFFTTAALNDQFYRPTSANDKALLHRACCDGDVARVRRLLARGASVNVKDELNYTPLHSACYRGDQCSRRTMAGLLLKYGANINAKGLDGWTPLHYVCYEQDWTTARFLIDRGANIAIKDGDGHTAFVWVRDVALWEKFREYARVYQRAAFAHALAAAVAGGHLSDNALLSELVASIVFV